MPASFQLLGGHPALDLVNTLDNRFGDSPDERLGTYADLLAFVHQTGLADISRIEMLASRASAADATVALDSAHQLREALAAVLYGEAHGPHEPAVPAIKILEQQFLTADQHRELAWQHPSVRFGKIAQAVWSWGRYETHVDLPVWLLARSAADLVTSPTMAQVRRCSSPTCGWLFLDSSRNHTRRWCDMKICGNRMKARRHHSRLRTPSG